jgi:hypothetical protein
MAHIPANVLIDHQVTSAVSHSSSPALSSDTLGHQLQTESASHHSSSSYNATGDGTNISSDPPALPHGDSTSMSHSGLRRRCDSLASIESSLEDQPEPKVSRSEHRTEVSADRSGKVKARDFSDDMQSTILLTCHYYRVTVCTENAFPSPPDQDHYASVIMWVSLRCTRYRTQPILIG